MNDLQRAVDPSTEAGVLYEIAERTPAARPLVAMHPNAYPGLLEWLASLDDPQVNRGLAHRHAMETGHDETPSREAPLTSKELEETPCAAPGTPESEPSTPSRASEQEQFSQQDLRSLGTGAVAGDRTTSTGRRRGHRGLVVGGVVVALLVAGGAAAVILPPMLDNSVEMQSNPDENDIDADSDSEAGPTFRDGAEIAWTLPASDVIPNENGTLGYDYPLFNIRLMTDEMAGWGMADGAVDAGASWVLSVGNQTGYFGDTPELELAALAGVDPSSGEVLWVTEGGFERCSSDGESLLVCSSFGTFADDGATVAIDPESGDELWRVEMSSFVTAAAEGVVVLCNAGEDDFVSSMVALDGESGDELWRNRYPVDLGSDAPPECEVGDGLVRGTYGLSAIVADLATGEVLIQTGYDQVEIANGRAVLVDRGRDTSLLPADVGPTEVLDSDRVDVISSAVGWASVVEGVQADYVVVEGRGSDLPAVSVVDAATNTTTWQFDGAPPTSWMPFATAERDGVERLLWNANPVLISAEASNGDDAIEIPLPEWALGAEPNQTEIVGLGDGVVGFTVDGWTAGIDAFSGEVLWELEVNGEPTIERPRGSEVLISDSREVLYRIAPASGNGNLGSVVLPADLPDCPGDTILLARAELSNGWALVCGYYPNEPTYVAVHSAEGDFESNAVTYDPELGRYSASLVDGSTIWLEHTPSTLGIRNASGVTTVQESVLYIYFIELGEGGAAQGTGDYDIDTPDHTDEEQVEYFSEILQRSQEARASLGPAVAAVRECSRPDGDYSTEIATIRDVRDNRANQLTAIQAAPVDLVPDGTELVDELSAALQASYNADVAYLDWAEDVQVFGCDPSAGDIAPEYTESAGVAKTRFAEHWNSLIAPRFGVPTVTREDL